MPALMSAGKLSRGFPPLAHHDASTLILGSLPSRRSLQSGEYFAHPRNVFWRIMGELIDAGPDRPYAQRVERMIAARFAVWDVLESAVRPGSLDAAIEPRTASPNDFPLFLREHPRIRRICFNGQKAAAMFEQLVVADLEDQAGALTFVTLPSTSPAHAAMKFEEKLRKWSVVTTESRYADALFHRQD